MSFVVKEKKINRIGETNMKKVLLTVALISVMLPLVCFTGTVTEVTGKVEIETDGGWKPLQKGDVVDTGKIISTGFRSTARIQVAGSSVVVNQLSRLSLEQLTETNDAHESEVFLDLGSISADVKTAQNKRVGFVVNTPVATASVRGTTFNMGVDSLSVTSGLVGLKGKNNIEMPVAKGTSTIITPSGKVAKPIEAKVATSLGQPVTEDPMQSVSTTVESAAGKTEAKQAQAAHFEIVVK